MTLPQIWPSWKQIEAAGRAGISCRAWHRLKSDGRAGAASWSATIQDAYDRTLLDLGKGAEANIASATRTGIDPRAPEPAETARLATHEEAIVLYRAMLERLSTSSAAGDDDALMLASARADINLWLGHALRIIGSADEAVHAYRAAAAACPEFGDAYWSLANLKTYRFTSDELAAMKRALALSETTDADRIQLSFALGKALEDQADYRGAWECYVQGNALQRQSIDYRPEVFEATVAAQVRVCTADFFAARQDWGTPSPDPIFILGLPRSGSTLVEQIVASHSAVDGTRELLAVERLALALQRGAADGDAPSYPAVLEQLTPDDCRRLGDRYLAVTRAHRRGRPFFTDKMPNNFLHIGLIALILPKARIIDVRRNPMACCVSNLKQLFATGQAFSYSIEDIARYYRSYLKLMRHWDAVLPGKVLRVCHEDLVADLDGQVRRLLAYCDLPFEAGCLAFHKTRRHVQTPSSEQVRQPINRNGLDQWRHFEFALDPLKAALGDALTNWRS